MLDIRKAFYRSSSNEIESYYNCGVLDLYKNDFNSAADNFKIAAKNGHISAIFNLCSIIGGGLITPYDFDLAANYWREAAEGGHPRAKESLCILDAADGLEFKIGALPQLAEDTRWNGGLVASTMISAARFYSAICDKHIVSQQVIFYELNAASTSDYGFVHKFIERTRIDKGLFSGSVDLDYGSVEDEITDDMNMFFVNMRRAGVSPELVAMARCSVVGYVIQNSFYGVHDNVLFGVDKFFDE